MIFDLDDTLFGEKEYVWSGYKAIANILSQVNRAEEKLCQAFEQKKSAINEVLTGKGIYTDGRKRQCLTLYCFY